MISRFQVNKNICFEKSISWAINHCFSKTVIMATSLAISSQTIRLGPWNETVSIFITAPAKSLNLYAKLWPGIRLLK